MWYRRLGSAVLVLIVMLLFVACEEEKEKFPSDQMEEVQADVEERASNEILFTFDTKVAMIEAEDGWVHHFICEFDKATTEPIMYYYDAYNLKYKKMDAYVIEVVNDNGDIEEIVYPSAPYMLLYDKYIEDFINIDNYFNMEKPISKLEEQKIDDLKLEFVDKQLVVNLFNKAIESDVMPDGKYYYLPEASIVQEKMMDGYLWQVGYFNVHGVVVSVNIELIYENGEYLTDIVNDGRGDTTQIAINDMISDMEENIIYNQSLVANDRVYEEVADTDYHRLSVLLQKIEEGGYN